MGGADPIVLRFDGRPPTLNSERSRHWRRHRVSTAAYRAETRLRYTNRLAPVSGPVEVRSWPTYRTRRSWPDVGAWLPATKAVIDGLVDLKVLPDDTSDVVVRITFDPPQLAKRDQLIVQLIPWPQEPV